MKLTYTTPALSVVAVVANTNMTKELTHFSIFDSEVVK